MAAAGLLEQVGDSSNQAGERSQKEQNQRHAAPHLGFTRQAGLVRSMRPRHAERQGSEEQQRGSENVEVAGH